MGELAKLKGIGPKTEKFFEKLDIRSKEDLLCFYPRDYEAYDNTKKIIELDAGEVATIDAVIVTKPAIFRKGKMSITSIWLDDGSGRIRAFWFNSPFMSKNLHVGEKLLFRGKISRVRTGIALTQAKVYKKESYENLKGMLNPIYSLTKGLTNYSIKKAMKELIIDMESDTKSYDILNEYIPNEIIKKRSLCDLLYAYKNIHFPKDYDEMYAARKRLVYDEFFIFSLSLLLNKDRNIKEGRKELCDVEEKIFLDIKNKLPYELTHDQVKTIENIIDDLKMNKKLNRLIEGDVGSGKTIVAIITAMLYVSKNIQVAFMAPTELLAEQHYNTICKMVIDGILPKNINVAFLSGSTKVKERNIILKKLSSGEINIIIGTHALFSSDVIYKDLGICIIDEQHRFGVEQRNALMEKSKKAGILAMSATPIPRTLAMLIYADVDISYLKEKPKDRLKIKNCVISKNEREKAYKAIKKEIEAGHQAYVICAAIDKIEDEDVGSFANYQNVNDYAKVLKEYMGDGVCIEILHGKMKSEDKENVMKDFKDGKIDILVSTTVVEVGVDVKNATFIMVEDAGSFGLAELHQLRGRVGRGEAQSYALFVDTNQTEKTKERLEVLNNSNDGFFIAEEDLRLRGAGDIFGVRQSGSMEFKIGDMYTDYAIFKDAQSDAKDFIDGNHEMTKILERKVKNNQLNSQIM